MQEEGLDDEGARLADGGCPGTGDAGRTTKARKNKRFGSVRIAGMGWKLHYILYTNQQQSTETK